MDPRISIIIPIFNMEKYLGQCLESVLDQTMKNLEIVCINDGSTDDSKNILDSYAEKDSRIIVIDKSNSGYGDSVNRGIDASSGTYIGIVEPDDWIDCTMYQKLFDAAERHGYPDIVKSSYWRVINPDTDHQIIIPSFYLNKIKYVDSPFTLNQDAQFLFFHPSIWAAIYKREFLDAFNIRMFPIPGAGWTDNPFLIETLVQAESIIYLNENLYFYREFGEGSSSNVKDPSIIYKRWFEMDGILKRLNISNPHILEGHYARGCAYIQMLDSDFTKTESIDSAIKEMMNMMNYRQILSSKRIIPAYKHAYLKHLPVFKRIIYCLQSYRLFR